MAVSPKRTEWLPYLSRQSDDTGGLFSAAEGRETTREYEFAPLIDVYESEGALVVEIEAPGIEPSDFSLSICQNMLIVEGCKQEDIRSEEVNYICVERSFGRFYRAIEVPLLFDLEGCTARYEKGVLRVSFPRLHDQALVREIPIE